MHGQMMSAPLLISSLITHAARHCGDVPIVSRRVEGDIHRTTYAQLHDRTRRMARALGGLGVQLSQRVATLAWNGYRHLELYFAVSGSGSVLHTLNPRLHPDQLLYILDHAEDQVLFFDLTFLPLVEAVAGRCKTVRHFVAMIDKDKMPASKLPNLLCYEDLISAHEPDFVWPTFDENTASSLCYTSGTTGNPKGVLYSHRSTMLHTYASVMPDAIGISSRDCVMPVVPMFHVNAWGLPYSCAMVGAKLVLPGPALDGKSLHELIAAEQVSFAAGVPTIWLGMLQYVSQNSLSLAPLKRTIIGGSAVPPSMMRTFEDNYGIEVIHAWGMTEMSPLGTVCRLRQKHLADPLDSQHALLAKQGKAVFGVDMRIVDPEGADVLWDGKTQGDLLVRGPWVVQSYFGSDGAEPLVSDATGAQWFPTGDVATIDTDGYMQITDRSKDVIKSGGEWIGSIDLENVAMAHPAVAMAAAIAVPHPKWDERPLLVVVRKPGAEVTREELIEHYKGKVASWWVPDDVVFVEAIPIGATGKMLKNQLREQFKDHRLPGV
ncbi:MAG: 3-(methylthio)propionyl-CoA ligase [Burkholderiaceae bacterium]|nr:3-(methylthio)propionyl-CoA ligase [Burkholderiaceae bacterium]